MFNKKSSRPSLALFVALTLGSGAFLAPSAADAADVSGQNVTIRTHLPITLSVHTADMLSVRPQALSGLQPTAEM